MYRMSRDLRSILQDLIPEVIYTWVWFATDTNSYEFLH